MTAEQTKATAAEAMLAAMEAEAREGYGTNPGIHGEWTGTRIAAPRGMRILWVQAWAEPYHLRRQQTMYHYGVSRTGLAYRGLSRADALLELAGEPRDYETDEHPTPAFTGLRDGSKDIGNAPGTGKGLAHGRRLARRAEAGR